MIKKGMNVGDTFEDCGGFYMVAALSGSHYVSKRITKEEYERANKEPEEQPSEETAKEPEEQPSEETAKEPEEQPKQKTTAKTRRASSK